MTDAEISELAVALFTGVTGIFILIVLVLWVILTFFAPFLLYSIAQSNKKILAELRKKEPYKSPKQVEPEL